MKDGIRIYSDDRKEFVTVTSTEGIVAKKITGKVILSEEPLEIVEEDDNTIQLIQNFYENRRG